MGYLDKFKDSSEAAEYERITVAYNTLNNWFDTEDIQEVDVKDLARKFREFDAFELSFALQALIQDKGYQQDYIVINDETGKVFGRYRQVADIPNTTDPEEMASNIGVIVVRKR